MGAPPQKKERQQRKHLWNQECSQFLWHSHAQEGSWSSISCTNSSSSVSTSPSGLCWKLQLCNASVLDAALESDDLWRWRWIMEVWHREAQCLQPALHKTPEKQSVQTRRKGSLADVIFFKLQLSDPGQSSSLSCRWGCSCLPACRASGYKEMLQCT